MSLYLSVYHVSLPDRRTHSYTATQSNLRSYTVPSWVVAGGDSAMVRRFDDPDTLPVIDRQTREMLAIRGGADHILIVDQRADLNGKTLADVAVEWGLTAPEAARRILRDGNAAVMNLGLYDDENTRYLAGLAWMMTCTDGRDPGPSRPVTHPRAFGSFTSAPPQPVSARSVTRMGATVRPGPMVLLLRIVITVRPGNSLCCVRRRDPSSMRRVQ